MIATLRYLGEVYQTSSMRGLGGGDRLQARIRRAASCATLLDALESMANTMGGHAKAATLEAVLSEARERGPAILAWLRGHTNTATGLVFVGLSQDGDLEAAVSGIKLETAATAGDVVRATVEPQIPIEVRLLSPLAHGSDDKAGNATLFRRMTVLAANGGELRLPYYAANAFRGHMRDMIADEWTGLIGLKPSRTEPPYAPWFFHTLYSGGSPQAVPKPARKAAGERANSTVALRDRREFREMLPHLSAFGFSLGSDICGGKFDALDFLPVCRETGATDAPPAESLMAWRYLTKRDDLDTAKGIGEHEGMIADFEVMVPGATLRGGVDLRPHARPLECGAIAAALEGMRSAHLGAGSRQGWGRVELSFAGDPAAAEAWRADTQSRAEAIVSYLRGIEALA